MNAISLSDHLTTKTALHDVPDGVADGVADAIEGLATAAIAIAQLAARNGLASHSASHSDTNLGSLSGGQNEDGDSQKQLDVMADALVCDALRAAQVGCYFSEEQSAPVRLHEGGVLGVACDPLDGSSNIDTNLTIGTIFSIFIMADCDESLPPKGRKQLAAGFFVYGPQTALLLSFGDEVTAFALTDEGQFMALDWQVAIPKSSREFAINASNAAFWPKPIQDYIHSQSYGAGAASSGMRWLGSLVADAFRIFRRGGVFLYPQDSRKGYEEGRLRLVYEANPIAFLVEAAGGRASDGTTDILDIPPTQLHQRVPFIFGSTNSVDDITNTLTIARKGS